MFGSEHKFFLLSGYNSTDAVINGRQTTLFQNFSKINFYENYQSVCRPLHRIIDVYLL